MSNKTKMAVTDEMAFNDMRLFLESMKLSQERIDGYLNDPTVREFLPKFFQNGVLRLEAETNCLVQILEDGREIKYHPARPTQKDLNMIKPPNYDKMDADNKELVNVSFLTKIPFRSLQEDYFKSDLDFARNMCYFF